MVSCLRPRKTRSTEGGNGLTRRALRTGVYPVRSVDVGDGGRLTGDDAGGTSAVDVQSEREIHAPMRGASEARCVDASRRSFPRGSASVRIYG